MPFCTCPHCGRVGIRFELHEAQTVLTCAKCEGQFTPAGGAVFFPPSPPTSTITPDVVVPRGTAPPPVNVGVVVNQPSPEQHTDAPGVVALIFGMVAMVCSLTALCTFGITYLAAAPLAIVGLGAAFFGRGNVKVAGITLNLLALIPVIIVGVNRGMQNIDNAATVRPSPARKVDFNKAFEQEMEKQRSKKRHIVCGKCGEEIAVEQGKAEATCPHCGAVNRIMK